MSERYKVEFMEEEHLEGNNYRVHERDDERYIDFTKPLVVNGEDISYLRKFGNGFRYLERVPELS